MSEGSGQNYGPNDKVDLELKVNNLVIRKEKDPDESELERRMVDHLGYLMR